MADDQTVRLTSRLMNHDQVSEVIRLADLDEILKDIATTIHASGVWQD